VIFISLNPKTSYLRAGASWFGGELVRRRVGSVANWFGGELDSGELDGGELDGGNCREPLYKFI